MDSAIQYKDRHERYRKENAEAVAESKRRYRQANREKLRVKNKEYRAQNPEKQKRYFAENRDRILANMAQYRAENKDKINAQCRAWHQNNKDEHNARKREWWAKNKESLKLSSKQYYLKNKHVFVEGGAIRRARKKNASPPWLTKEDRRQMRELYKLSAEISLKTGVRHHVDHIYPLAGEFSCGLHVPWNLQVITAHENQTKYNKL